MKEIDNLLIVEQMRKSIYILIISTLILVIFLKYGRSVYMPIINKMKGEETVESISEKIKENALVRLRPYLEKNGFNELPQKIVLIGLKEEQILEVYALDSDSFLLLKSYPFAAFSGSLGPKLKEGDKQIPEGIYKIEYLNPNSSYYLSMKINYPNEFDLQKTKFITIEELGSDIFIHGKAVTIGCIPIGDEAIEELFILVSNALPQNVKIIISPRDFRINPEFPKIDVIEWEDQLYSIIKKELSRYSKNI